jgi:hypothetical protein
MRRGAGVSRRELTRLALAAAIAPALSAHTPYAQWTIYRRRNLFVVASRTDEEAVRLARAVAEGLAAELPDSRARFTRASDSVRIASLLTSGQLDVAVIGRGEAGPMLAGAGPYTAVGAVPLRLVAELGEHLLVTVEGFKDRHAFLLAEALGELQPRLALAEPATERAQAVPYHPGALAYRRGEPIPSASSDPGSEPHARPHTHQHPQ